MSLLIRDLRLAHGKRLVLENLSLEPIEPGAMVAVLGPNGVGKSTLIRALAGMHTATGEALLGDQPLLGIAPWRQRARVGYLPQHLPQATSLLAYELLQGACRARGGAAGGADVRIAAVLSRLGIEALALRRLSELSGGQRQLVGLAQVLVSEPRLLLFDEPTSALDLRWQLRVLQVVRELTQERGCIALVACHDLNLALRHCDRLLLLAPGGHYRLGTADQVLDADWLRLAYGVEARIERCSAGWPLVLADRAVPDDVQACSKIT